MTKERFVAAVIPLLTAVCMTGCGMTQMVHANMIVGGKAAATAIDVYQERGSAVWIPLQAVAATMGMRCYQQRGNIVIGTSDPAYTITIDRYEALHGDQAVTLSDAPKRIGIDVYMTDRALTELLGTPLHWDNRLEQLSVAPINHRALAVWLSAYHATYSPTMKSDYRNSPLPIQPNAAVPMTEFIAYALQLQGALYRFDATANTTDEPQAFDSSSLTHHIYRHFGIDLPRTAISQATRGTAVLAPEQLKPGDLMFFDAVGPIPPNQTVSHVGLYVGGNRFIHVYEGSNVAISDLNEFWQQRLLFARRIVPSSNG